MPSRFKKKLLIKTNESEISLNELVAESTDYCFDINEEKEGYYLISVLNSKLIDDIIKPMQAKGQFGERHIHKKPLELPIPKFNPRNKLHLRLSELGEICTKKAERGLPKLAQKYTSIGKIRNEIRKLLQDKLKEIDELVAKIFSENESKNIFHYTK